jgi:inosine/xanthosine triphosphatase
MKIVVASSNPVKINAVKTAYGLMFPDVIFTVEGSTLDGFTSALPSQPIGDEVTRQCAIERVQSLKLRHPDADLWVGIEGGAGYCSENSKGEMECFAWVVCEAKNGCFGTARTASFPLPQAVADLLQQGFEMGHANDQIFDMKNSKHGWGMTGILTSGVLDRTAYYTHAAILALVPFKNDTLYFTTQNSEAV